VAVLHPQDGGDIVTAPTSNPLERHPLVQLLVMMLPVSNALVGCPGPDARGTRCAACPITMPARTPAPCTLQELATERSRSMDLASPSSMTQGGRGE
jgi:hypothetical protein